MYKNIKNRKEHQDLGRPEKTGRIFWDFQSYCQQEPADEPVIRIMVQQSTTDLQEHLKKQLGFLKLSCKSYDSGYTDEACRLATVIRVLVHDTATSKSLLGQLKVKSSMGFFDSSPDYIPAEYFIDFRGLAVMYSGPDDGKFVPRCHFPPNPDIKETFKPFGEWWQKIVIVDGHGRKFTRQKIILNLANKDGGAHVDPKLDNDYAALTRENSMGWTYEFAGVQGPVTGIELASSRQMAYEIVQSIRQCSIVQV